MMVCQCPPGLINMIRVLLWRCSSQDSLCRSCCRLRSGLLLSKWRMVSVVIGPDGFWAY